MPRRAITKADIDAAMESFRWAPGNIHKAARAAKISWRTARRLWLFGIPGKCEPLCERLAEEQLELRARMWRDAHPENEAR